VTYYFQVTNRNMVDPLDAPLTFSLVAAPAASAVGSIMAPDDHSGWPMAIISSTTDQVLQFREFVAGESGEMLPNGTVLMSDAGQSGAALPSPADAARFFGLVVDTNLTRASERFAAWPIVIIKISRSGISERQFASLGQLRAA